MAHLVRMSTRETSEGGDATEADRAPLAVRGLTKHYSSGAGIERISFDARAGEILGLVGPNGAGKTTTLRCIAGVLPYSGGRVLVDGHDLQHAPEEAKRRLSWVPDEPRPFDTLTVFEHLEFTARLYRVPGWEEQAEELLVRFELAERRDALGSELSRGMRQKLAFCCAWIANPCLVLLDEPLSGLDPRGIRAARGAIRALADGGVAVVLSSHLLELIEALADRLLIVDRGARVFAGTLDEARQSVAAGEDHTLEEIFLAVTGDDAAEAGRE